MVRDLFQRIEDRDPAEVLPETLPDPLKFESQREFVRETLAREVDLRSVGPDYGTKDSAESLAYRKQLDDPISPSTVVAADYRWRPGTELVQAVTLIH